MSSSTPPFTETSNSDWTLLRDTETDHSFEPEKHQRRVDSFFYEDRESSIYTKPTLQPSQAVESRLNDVAKGCSTESAKTE